MKTLEHVVTQEENGWLLKRVLKTGMNLSSHMLKSMKALDAVTVNGILRYANQPVKVGEIIKAVLPDVVFDDRLLIYDETPVDIMYEDDDLLVINKPAPLPTVYSPRQEPKTLENRILYKFRDDPDFIFRPINRLDKGTSGLLAAAKHPVSQWYLQQRLHTEEFSREYLALAVGHLKDKEGTIDLPIAKADEASVKRVIDYANGKSAVTQYRVIEETRRYSLVRLKLFTGRTHQIRVHLSALGCPIVGDFLYGEEHPNLSQRFALHSAYIRLPRPSDGKAIEISSPLPQEIQSILNND